MLKNNIEVDVKVKCIEAKLVMMVSITNGHNMEIIDMLQQQLRPAVMDGQA